MEPLIFIAGMVVGAWICFFFVERGFKQSLDWYAERLDWWHNHTKELERHIRDLIHENLVLRNRSDDSNSADWWKDN